MSDQWEFGEPRCTFVGIDPQNPGPQFCIFPDGHEGQHLSRPGSCRMIDPRCESCGRPGTPLVSDHVAEAIRHATNVDEALDLLDRARAMDLGSRLALDIDSYLERHDVDLAAHRLTAWFNNRASSYWRDAQALRAEGDESMAVAYQAIAAELRRIPAELLRECG